MTDPWPFPGDPPLERARAIARSYRSALHAHAPTECARLDEKAVALGQAWIAPTELPADLVEDALDAELSAADIEHFWRIPSSTIRAWATKGLLTRRCAPDGSPRYLVRDVLDVQSRARRRNT